VAPQMWEEVGVGHQRLDTAARVEAKGPNLSQSPPQGLPPCGCATGHCGSDGRRGTLGPHPAQQLRAVRSDRMGGWSSSEQWRGPKAMGGGVQWKKVKHKEAFGENSDGDGEGSPRGGGQNGGCAAKDFQRFFVCPLRPIGCTFQPPSRCKRPPHSDPQVNYLIH
jgi:hypothetical protein